MCIAPIFHELLLAGTLSLSQRLSQNKTFDRRISVAQQKADADRLKLDEELKRLENAKKKLLADEQKIAEHVEDIVSTHKKDAVKQTEVRYIEISNEERIVNRWSK